MLRSASGKIKTIKIDLPFQAKEKLKNFVAFLNTNKLKNAELIESFSEKKVLSVSDKKYLLDKFK